MKYGWGVTAQVEIFGSGLSGLGSSLQAILTVFYPESVPLLP